jgi:hypothetical protein
MPAWGFNATGNVFDRDSEVDGILYRNDWESGFGLKAFYIKFRTPNNTQVAYEKDGDYDRFSVEPYYKWDGGGASFALQYDRNQYLVDGNAALGFYEKNYFVSFNPAFVHSFPLGADKSLAIHAEAKISRGKIKTQADEKEIDQEGTGAYLDFTLNYPAGNASLAGWWFDGGVSGPGAPEQTKKRGALDPGEGFYPFMIFYYGNNFLLGSGEKSLEGFQTPNHWALSLLGNHKLTDDVTLNYGIAHFSKSKNFIRADGSAASKSLGTEVDLGVVVNIYKNLQWYSKVGVFSPGKYYNESTGRDDLDKTIWGWANEFLFTF